VNTLKITSEVLPLIRKYKGLSQEEFSNFVGIPQSKLSLIESKKIPISDYYSARLFLAIGKLQFTEKEFYYLSELAREQTN